MQVFDKRSNKQRYMLDQTTSMRGSVIFFQTTNWQPAHCKNLHIGRNSDQQYWVKASKEQVHNTRLYVRICCWSPHTMILNTANRISVFYTFQFTEISSFLHCTQHPIICSLAKSFGLFETQLQKETLEVNYVIETYSTHAHMKCN